MSKNLAKLGLVVAVLFATTCLTLLPKSKSRPAQFNNTDQLPGLSNLPLAIEPNLGQADFAVEYMAHLPNGAVLFTPQEIVVSLQSATLQEGESAIQPLAALGLSPARSTLR